MAEPLQERPLLPRRWWLLLLLVIGAGIVLLRRVDALLHREYVREAGTQAVQTDALLEAFVRQRVELLRSLRSLIASAGSGREERARFSAVARELLGESPDVASLQLLDSSGAVREVYRGAAAAPRVQGLIPPNALSPADMARLDVARRRAGGSEQPVVSATVHLAEHTPGMTVYVPVLRGDAVAGYVAGSYAYRTLFSDALAGQLQGHFAYRVRDDRGQIIGVSPDYPEHPGDLLRRPVALPGGRSWTLEVAIPAFQPFTARLVNWLTGLLVLALVVFLVLREQARARRSARHSRELELLTRDLLDANLRLEERSLQIAEANRAKSRFLANVSHELRTPLNAILGYNALALEQVYGALPAPLEAAHQRIQLAAEHLLGLVDDVLDLSKIEVGRMDVSAREVELADAVDGVAGVVEPIAHAKGLRIHVVVTPGVPRVRTDPNHLRQILFNLVSNAIKFTERGSVTIIVSRARADQPAVACITVQDTGVGIAAADLERIFQEFEQVRPSGRGDSMQRGTGLGLAIARKLARLLGGDLTVQSAPGNGSRFTLLLPPEPPRSTSGEERKQEAGAAHVDGAGAGPAREVAVPVEPQTERAPRDDAPESTGEHASPGLDAPGVSG